MSSIKFTGIFPAIVTPFCEDNKTVNTDVARVIVNKQISDGASGFYVLGGTGEGFVMEREQREIMCQTVVDEVRGRVPVITHIASANLNDAIELAKHAEACGADAIAAIPPTLFHYGDNEIYNYYKKLANNVHIPLIIYYHPNAQKNMSANLISRIFEIDNVTGVKWSSYDLFELMKLQDITQGEINTLIGDEEILLPALAAGADAGVGATYNILLKEFVSLYQDFKANKLDQALATQIRINKVISLICDYEIIPGVKLAMRISGLDVGNATFPLKQYTKEEEARFEADMYAVGWPFH